MKEYIIPKCEVIEVLQEGYILTSPPDEWNDEVGDDDVWLAPEYKHKEIGTDVWQEW